MNLTLTAKNVKSCTGTYAVISSPTLHLHTDLLLTSPIALYYNIVPLTIHRCPDDSKIGDKMIYASTKDSLKKAFSGLSLEFQANDRGDFDYDTYAAEVEKKA